MRRKKKSGRKKKAFGLGQSLDGRTPTPRDAVLLPLVDGLTVLPVRSYRAPQGNGDGSPATEFVYEAGVGVLLHIANVRNIFGVVKATGNELSSDDAAKLLRDNAAMPKIDERDPHAIEVGLRLRAAREALGYKVLRRFAENTGVDEDNLSNWERGVSMVPVSYVQRLKEVFGVTHDWIFGGDASTMRHDLARALLTTDARR